MNVFTTDHPMVSEPSPFSWRQGSWLLMAVCSYPINLLLLGSFWALEGRGVLDAVPTAIREACFFPAAPVFLIPGWRGDYEDYLNWWCHDPNQADRETGWR